MKQSENEIKINKTKHFFTQCVLQLWNCSLLRKDVVEVRILIPPARSCQRSESCIREDMILDKTIPEPDSVRLFLFYFVLTKKPTNKCRQRWKEPPPRRASSAGFFGKFLLWGQSIPPARSCGPGLQRCQQKLPAPRMVFSALATCEGCRSTSELPVWPWHREEI